MYIICVPLTYTRIFDTLYIQISRIYSFIPHKTHLYTIKNIK